MQDWSTYNLDSPQRLRKLSIRVLRRIVYLLKWAIRLLDKQMSQTIPPTRKYEWRDPPLVVRTSLNTGTGLSQRAQLQSLIGFFAHIRHKRRQMKNSPLRLSCMTIKSVTSDKGFVGTPEEYDTGVFGLWLQVIKQSTWLTFKVVLFWFLKSDML